MKHLKKFKNIKESFDWVKNHKQLPIGFLFKPNDLDNGTLIPEIEENKLQYNIEITDLFNKYTPFNYVDDLLYSMIDSSGESINTDYEERPDMIRELTVDEVLGVETLSNIENYIGYGIEPTSTMYSLMEVLWDANEGKLESIIDKSCDDFNEESMNEAITYVLSIYKLFIESSRYDINTMNDIVTIDVEYPYNGEYDMSSIIESIMEELYNEEWNYTFNDGLHFYNNFTYIRNKINKYIKQDG